MSDVAGGIGHNRPPEPIVAIAPILVPIPTAANMIGRGITFIYGAIADGTIEAVKSDGRTLVVVESLRAYAAGLPPVKIKPIHRPPARLRKRRTA
ncbi:MAG TPA: hypothetical protein VF913_12240 [Xanthobacteraceae bacterium]